MVLHPAVRRMRLKGNRVRIPDRPAAVSSVKVALTIPLPLYLDIWEGRQSREQVRRPAILILIHKAFGE